MAENRRHKRHALLKAMKNVVPLKPPPDCAKLAAQLREILCGEPSAAERLTFERDLHGLRPAQRAMIGAHVANCRRGDGVYFRADIRAADHNGQTDTKITVAACADVMQVSVSAIHNARTILKRATVAEIRALEQGELGAGGIRTIATQLRQNLTAGQRKRLAETPLSERGDSPARIQNQRLKALVWRQLCNALEAANLPRLEDIVAIARSHDKTGLVDRKLLRAHERLGELIEAWTRPTEPGDDR